jgi:carboxymethylenebutenolidase
LRRFFSKKRLLPYFRSFEMMQLTAADGHRFEAFEAGNVNAPRCLVVVQEIFGVNAHMRLVSERLAGFGYRVLSPALFDRVERNAELGYAPEDMKKGVTLRGQISDEAVLADIEATAAALGDRPIGIIGYCWGGSLAWVGATQTERFKAAIGWYGGQIVKTKDATPNCPVQLHFGEVDAGIPLSDVEAIKAAHPEIPVFVYPGAQHGFGCEARPSYSPKDAELAELRSLAFFAEHLR